jgi:ketosteroid isomerase-like protein
MRHIRVMLLCLLICLIVVCTSSAQGDDRAGVTATFEAFYGAMKKGDVAAAMKVIAPDAVFLEGGQLESRAEYESSHLPADIAFEKAVTGVRGPLNITINGNTAWVIATATYEGTFENKPVNFVSAQLMVLTKGDGPWLIRSVHWSSRRR